MRQNKVLHAWRDRQQTVGAWLMNDSALSAEVMTRAGFDWLCIDTQHGLLDYHDIKALLPVISQTDTVPFVRVSWNDPAEIMKALDAGAYGVVVPMVNNREEAERAVRACRYPPDGMRSFGPTRAAMYGGAGYAAESNREIACIAMIETREAIGKLDEIMSTPGLDAIYIGPADLALALDLTPTGDNNEPKHVEMVDRIFEATRRHGIAAGIHTGSLEYTQRYLAQGFEMVTLGADTGFMARLARQELKAAREGARAGSDGDGSFY